MHQLIIFRCYQVSDPFKLILSSQCNVKSNKYSHSFLSKRLYDIIKIISFDNTTQLSLLLLAVHKPCLKQGQVLILLYVILLNMAAKFQNRNTKCRLAPGPVILHFELSTIGTKYKDYIIQKGKTKPINLINR